MQTPLVSLIVPVYNTAISLQRCVDSLTNQDYDNVEILLIDDGSTDDSLEICNKNANDKIKVYSKPNGGPASARNFGLMHCSKNSEYVLFVDSDDTIEHNYISIMLQSKADLIVCNIKHYNYGGTSTHDIEDKVFDNLKNNKEFITYFENGIMNSPCNKLFRLDIIRDNKLEFPDVKVLEDILFVFEYLKRCSSVEFKAIPLYNYYHRGGSQSMSYGAQIYDNYMMLQQKMYGWFDKSLEDFVDRFVYPQFLFVTLRFLSVDELSIPRSYICKSLIRKAFNAHKCSSLGEKVLHNLIKFRMLRLAKMIIIKKYGSGFYGK